MPKASPKVVYGKEMRGLFCVREPYRMLGADLKSIEAMVTSHWASLFDGGEYFRLLQSVGSIHDYNAELINNTRDVAKSFQYAIYFGARAPKLSRILGCSIEQAQIYIDNFWEGNKGVKMIVDYLTKFYKKHKFIVGLDGRKMMVRAEYKLLNTAIQGTAALIFKMWCINVNRKLRELGLFPECQQILEIHDELGFRCHKDLVDTAIPIIKEGANLVQKQLNLLPPIDCDVKVGMNWAETH